MVSLFLTQPKCYFVFQKVKLHFLRFYVDRRYSYCYYDRVRIYDGNDTTARLLKTLCGNHLPEDIVSSGNELFVHFYSNHNNIYPGFMIQNSAVEGRIYLHHNSVIFIKYATKITKCSHNLKALSLTIHGNVF